MIRNAAVAIALTLLSLPAFAERLELANRSLVREAAPKVDRATHQLLLPVYMVNRTNPGGLTTLMAIVNGEAVATPVAITYHTPQGATIGTNNHLIPAFGTLTINLRDVVGLPIDVDGVSRGWASIVTSPGTFLAGDYFLVDPANNFSQGERLIDFTDGPYCTFWNFRFAVGGIFSGGTTLTVITNAPLGPSQPSVGFEVFDEAGNFYGQVNLTTINIVNRISASTILAALPSAPVFGSFFVTFAAGTGGGIVLGEWNADGRFQVGFNGACME